MDRQPYWIFPENILHKGTSVDINGSSGNISPLGVDQVQEALSSRTRHIKQPPDDYH